jgi:hypothetical protein
MSQSPASKDVSTELEQSPLSEAMTSEDTEDIMCAVVRVIFSVCKSVRPL